MAAATTGKLIIRSIPGGNERERIIDFLCSFAKGAARESIAAKLESLPLTLGNAIPADIGDKVLASLQDLGAEAMFVYNRVESPGSPVVAAAHTDQPPEPAAVKEPEKPVASKVAVPSPPRPTPAAKPANNDLRALAILLLVLVAGLCGATAIFLPQLKAASDPDLLLNKLLQKNAELNNKTCPRTINPHLRLDSFAAGNKRITINYTLLSIDSTDVNGFQVQSSVSRDIREGICKTADSAQLLKKGVTFVFAVHGKDGGQIFDYQVAKDDCEGETEGQP